MMPAQEAPAVIPQAGFVTVQILDVQQELVFRLLLPGRLLQSAARPVEKQAGHEQGVVPQLLFIDAIAGQVLKAALLRAWQTVHDPFRPIGDEGSILFFLRHFVQQGQAQHGRGGVDVAARQAPGDVAVVPGFDFRQQLFVMGRFVHLQHGVQGHALGPFPGGQAQMIVPPSVAFALLQPVQHPIRQFPVIHAFFPLSAGFLPWHSVP